MSRYFQLEKTILSFAQRCSDPQYVGFVTRPHEQARNRFNCHILSEYHIFSFGIDLVNISILIAILMTILLSKAGKQRRLALVACSSDRTSSIRSTSISDLGFVKAIHVPRDHVFFSPPNFPLGILSSVTGSLRSISPRFPLWDVRSRT